MAATTHGTNDSEALINNVPEDRRTPDRDQAAREILAWQEAGEWPLSGPEMQDRGEYSAQHYRHVLSTYELEERGGGLHIPVPDDLDGRGEVRAYVRGWLDNLDGDE